MTRTPEFTSIRLKSETARKLRVLTANLKAAEPEVIGTSDDVVARLIEWYVNSKAAAKESDETLADWQNRFSDTLADDVQESRARIGAHVMEAITELRQILAKLDTLAAPNSGDSQAQKPAQRRERD